MNQNIQRNPKEYFTNQTQEIIAMSPSTGLSPNAIKMIPTLLGPDNTITVCPLCQANIRTGVKYTSTTRTHIAAAHFSHIFCCCCIPYCLNSAKNSDHYCPQCTKYIGSYEK